MMKMTEIQSIIIEGTQNMLINFIPSTKTLKQLWKELARAKKATGQDTYDCCLIRAIKAKYSETLTEEERDQAMVRKAFDYLQDAFRPITKKLKLENGRRKWDCIWKFAGNIYFKGPLFLCMNDAEKRIYDNLTKEIKRIVNKDEVPENRREIEYSYFFVRGDLSKEYQLVQNSHVALALGAELGRLGYDTSNLYFWCCGAESEDELSSIKAHIEKRGYRTIEFREPDIGNQVTAIASFPIKNKHRQFMKVFDKLTW